MQVTNQKNSVGFGAVSYIAIKNPEQVKVVNEIKDFFVKGGGKLTHSECEMDSTRVLGDFISPIEKIEMAIEGALKLHKDTFTLVDRNSGGKPKTTKSVTDFLKEIFQG